MMRYAVVQKPVNNWPGVGHVSPGTVVEVPSGPGMNFTPFISSGAISLLPDDPDQLEELAAKIRSAQEESEEEEETEDDDEGLSEEELIERQYHAERVILLQKVAELNIHVMPNWRNGTILKKIKDVESDWSLEEAMSDTQPDNEPENPDENNDDDNDENEGEGGDQQQGDQPAQPG